MCAAGFTQVKDMTLLAFVGRACVGFVAALAFVRQTCALDKVIARHASKLDAAHMSIRDQRRRSAFFRNECADARKCRKHDSSACACASCGRISRRQEATEAICRPMTFREGAATRRQILLGGGERARAPHPRRHDAFASRSLSVYATPCRWSFN